MPKHTAVVETKLIGAESKLTKLYSSYPLRCLDGSEFSRAKCSSVFLVRFGGGLLDRSSIDIIVREGSSLNIRNCSKKPLKFKSIPACLPISKQDFSAKVEDCALLSFLPLPHHIQRGTSTEIGASYNISAFGSICTVSLFGYFCGKEEKEAVASQTQLNCNIDVCIAGKKMFTEYFTFRHRDNELQDLRMDNETFFQVSLKIEHMHIYYETNANNFSVK